MSLQPCLLPPDLFDTYLSYKKSTRTIVSWMAKNGGSPDPGPRPTLSIKKLQKHSRIIRQNNVETPTSIAYIFRSMINSRIKLGKFFKKSAGVDDDLLQNESHDYFTSSLKQIYDDLCSRCGSKPVPSSPKGHCSVSSVDYPSDNRFGALRNASEFDEVFDMPDSVPSITMKKSAVSDKQEVLTSQPDHDELAADVELLRDLQVLQDVDSIVNSAWKQAGDGSMPIYLSAFITNAAFEVIKALDGSISASIDGSNPQALLTRHEDIQESLLVGKKTTIKPTVCEACADTSIVSHLQEPWVCLLQFEGQGAGDGEETACMCPIHQKPKDFIHRQNNDRKTSEHVVFTALLQNMRRLLKLPANHANNAVVRRGTPIYAEVDKWLNKSDSPNGIASAFGLHTLLKSYECFMCREQPPRQNCRIQALRLAEEVILNIRAVLADSTMPCRCCRTLAFYLELFLDDLTKYTREKIFDLYFQCPWVAGSHMLEILDATFYYGLRLCTYRYFVGAVLHTYNVLTKCNGMPQIPLLEHVCDIFSEVVFLGSRPLRNFHSCLLRFMGGRLEIHRKDRHSRSGSYNLRLPRRVDTGGFGLRKELNDDRFSTEKVSSFYYLKDKNYAIDDESILNNLKTKGRMAKEPKPKKPAPSPVSPGSNSEPISPQILALRRLQQTASSDFQGDLPIGKLNLFALYLACVRIVKRICDKSHEEQGIACICFAERLLSVTDEYHSNKRGGRAGKYPCQELVDVCKEAYHDVLGQVELSEFLWGI